jgi:hypothetical protein
VLVPSGAVEVLKNLVVQSGRCWGSAVVVGNTAGVGRWGVGLAMVASGVKPEGNFTENPTPVLRTIEVFDRPAPANFFARVEKTGIGVDQRVVCGQRAPAARAGFLFAVGAAEGVGPAQPVCRGRIEL